MEQFLTGNIWKKAGKLIAKKQKNFFCIAYVTTATLELNQGDILICDASKFSIKFGETSAKTLDYYFKRGVKIYSRQNVHAKLLLTKNFLLIGSANLSKSSAETLIESAVVTNSGILLSQAKAFLHNLKEESLLLGRKEIDALLEIKVVKRPFRPAIKSKTRFKQFGNRYWFISLFEINDKAYDKIRDRVEKTSNLISQEGDIDQEDIGFIKWSTKTDFSRFAKEGDEIIVKLNNESKTRSYVFPPSTILKKEIVDNFTYFYHDDRNSEENKIPWTKFQELTSKIDLKSAIGKRTKIISDDDISKIRALWVNQK